jgi:GT2 family glycosyltransferase
LRAPGDLEVTLRMLESLRATEPEVEPLLVDDGSPADVLVDELEAAMSRLDSRLIRRPDNAGFSSTVNVGLREALDSGRDAILVNADMEFFEEGWAERMAAQPRADGEGPAAIVGALLLYPNGLIQHAGIFFSLLHRTFGHRYQYAPGDLPEAQHACVCPVTGALQYIRHSTMVEIGLYDEDFRLGFEDVDYCFRALTAGHDVVYQPTVRALHYESLFRGQRSEKIERWQEESWMTFMRKWKDQSFAQWVPPM